MLRIINIAIKSKSKSSLIAIILILLLGYSTAEGTSTADSLQAILKQKNIPDSTRIDALHALGWELKRYKIADALPYAEAALEILSNTRDFVRLNKIYYLLADIYRALEQHEKALAYYRSCNIAAQQIEDYRQLTYSHSHMATIFQGRLGDKEKGQLHIKKMQEYSAKVTEKDVKAYTLRKLGNYYCLKGDFEACMSYLDSSLVLYRELNDTVGLTMLYMDYGHYSIATGSYDKSIPYYQKAYAGFRNFGRSKYMSETVFGIGKTYQSQGNAELAMAAFMEALKLSEKIGDENRVALCYENIANIYKEQGTIERAESYYFKALDVFNRINNRRHLASTYLKIGNFYREQDDMDKALEYLEIGEQLAEETKSELSQAMGLAYKGLYLKDQKSYNQALDYFQQALGIYKSLGQKGQTAEVYHEIAEVYHTLNQNNQAILYAKRAYELASEIKKIALIQSSTFLLSENYERLGFHKAALDYYKIHKAATDTLLSASRNNLQRQLQSEFESDEMDRENELLRKANALKDSELNRQRSLLIFAILIVVLVGLLAGMQYRNQRLREKANRGLQSLNETVVQQNHQLQDLNKEIAGQNEELQKLNREIGTQNEELQQFAYIASHDLQEPLRMVGNFVQLLEVEFAEELGDEGQMYINFAVDGVTRMSQLIDDLLLYSRVNRREGKQRLISIKMLVEQKLKDLSIFVGEKNATVTVGELPEAIYCEPSQIGSVFQNLMHNGMKFNTSSTPTIEVKGEEREHTWLFTIKDNGIGIAPQNHDAIFDVFTRLHRKEEYKGTGIGLALVKRIIEQHGGEIWIESSLGKGTTFFFTLPK